MFLLPGILDHIEESLWPPAAQQLGGGKASEGLGNLSYVKEEVEVVEIPVPPILFDQPP